MATQGHIHISSNFERRSPLPLDPSLIRDDIADRDNIPDWQRYPNMIISILNSKVKYQLVLGTVDMNPNNNANWTEIFTDTDPNSYYTKLELQGDGTAQVHWNNLTNKPIVYPPEAHSHTESDISDLDKYSQSEIDTSFLLYYTKSNLQTSGQSQVHWDNITNTPTFTTNWGLIAGTISDQLDLQVELDGKVDDSQVLTDVPAGAVFTDTIYDDTAVLAHINDNNNPHGTVFTGLTDTPIDYTGSSLQSVRVNSGETGLEFYTPTSGTGSFIGLTDTPASYTAQAGKLTAVNSGESALEFVDNLLHVQNTDYIIYNELLDTSPSFVFSAGTTNAIFNNTTKLYIQSFTGNGNYVSLIQTLWSAGTERVITIKEGSVVLVTKTLTVENINLPQGPQSAFVLNYPVEFKLGLTYSIEITNVDVQTTFGATIYDLSTITEGGTPYPPTSCTIDITLGDESTLQYTDKSLIYMLRNDNKAQVITQPDGNVNMYGKTLSFNDKLIESSKWTSSGSDIYYNSGNVGIGTSTPNAKLSISRETAQPSIKAINDGYLIMDSSGSFLSLNHYINDNIIIANGGGNVGIGTTAPGYTLEVVGDFYVLQGLISPSTYLSTTATAANVVVDSTGSLQRSTSSREIKSNIKYTVDPNLALNLQPVTFNEKSTGNPFIGFIAEEVNVVDSRLATNQLEKGLMGLDMNAIVASLVSTVQAQDKKIESLEIEIQAIKSALNM